MAAMAALPGPLPEPVPTLQVELAQRSEAVARAWAVLVLVVVSATTPILYLQADRASGPGLTEEGTTLWSAIRDVLLGGVDEYAVDPDAGLPGRVGLALVLARVAVALLVVGLVLAASVAVRWLSCGDLDEVTPWQRWSVVAVLVVGAVLLVVGAGQVGDPDEDTLARGLDVAAGLWASVAVAFAVGVRTVADRWAYVDRR